MSLLSGYDSPIGLDISDQSAKLVQLKKRGDNISIQALGKVDLPEGLLVNGEIKNHKELVKHLHKLINHPDYGKVTTNEVCVCLPEGKTFLKIVEIDKETTHVNRAIKNQLEKHIPLPADSLYFDWQIIGNSDRSHLALIGAAEQKIVNDKLQLLTESKLCVTAIEPEQVSVCRCLLKEESPKPDNKNQKNCAIVDIGATDASLTFYAKNTILFSLNLPVSGEEITKKIESALDINREHAEKVKILYGLVKNTEESEAAKIIADMVGELSVRCKEAVIFFNHHFSSWGPIEQIFVCGGGANIKDLDKLIQKETQIPTIKGNVFTNFKNGKDDFFTKFRHNFGLNTDFLINDSKESSKSRESKTVKISQDVSLCYVTAIGLALRGIFIDE